MQCPTCKRPLWRDLLRNVYKPSTGDQHSRCHKCAQPRILTLPYYLSEDEYVLFGGMVIGLSLLAVLGVDTWPALKVQLFMSVMACWTGLIALLTWTHTRVR